MSSLTKTKFLSWKKSATHTLIIDSRSKKQIHRLNEVGSFLWELLESCNSQEELVEKLIDRYDLTRNEAQKDVEEYVFLLIQKGLLNG